MHFGKDEGLNYDTLSKEKKEEIDSWDYSPEKGESWKIVKTRLTEFLEEKAEIGKNQVLFTHGGTICSLTYDLGIQDMISPAGVLGISACLLYTSPSPRDLSTSRMPSSA